MENLISNNVEDSDSADNVICNNLLTGKLETNGTAEMYSHQAITPPVKKQWRQLGLYTYIKILITAVLFWNIFRVEINNIVYQWINDSSWSHGFLIPLFSLFFINQHKDELLNLRPVPNYFGLFFLIASILFYVFNIVSPSGWVYFRAISIITALGSVVFLLGGRALLRYTWLAIAFLIFAVPLPGRIYRSLTNPMQQWAAGAAAALLNLVSNMEASARGAIIDVVYQGHQLEPALDVAEACSGMRLLMAFLALGVAMAYLHYRPAWQRIILIISTIPIAIFCNIVRVTATGFIYVLIHPKYAQGIYHDALGMAMLPLAFGLYGLIAWFVSNLFIEDNTDLREDIIVRSRDV